MGLLNAVKKQYEDHEKKKAEHGYQQLLDDWQKRRENAEHLLGLIKTFKGTPSDQIMLKPGEGLYYTVTGTSLIEQRRGAGHYEGRSSGISVPIGGHGVRYRVGTSKGHFVQGAPTPAAVDVGTTYITDKRVIFQGNNQTRECSFDKVLGIQHDDANGSTTISVSNRQKPTTIHYGAELSGAFDFRLELALAHYRNTLPQLVTQIEGIVAKLDEEKPTPSV